MKKLAMTAIAAAALMSAGVANAYTTGTFQNGFVVPNVYKSGPTKTTAVGLINKSGATVPVYWAFFDVNSNHKYDGCFEMTNNDMESFVWSDRSPARFEGERGYLVFAAGNSSSCEADDTLSSTAQINGQAFYVDLDANDVAYTPVIDGPLTIGGDLVTMGPDSLTEVGGATPFGSVLNLKYYTAGGATTAITIWSTGDHSGNHTVQVYDNAQNRNSTQMELENAELDVVVLDGSGNDAVARDDSFTDGFIEWVTPSQSGSVFAYSTIDAPAFGAVQTILGAHQ